MALPSRFGARGAWILPWSTCGWGWGYRARWGWGYSARHSVVQLVVHLLPTEETTDPHLHHRDVEDLRVIIPTIWLVRHETREETGASEARAATS